MNYAYVEPNLSVDVLWQDSSTSWQAPGVGGYSDLAKQFLALMGNDPDSPWTLVLDIEGPYRRVEKGAWTEDKLGDFLQALDRLGVSPQLAYHPNAEKSIGDWVDPDLPQTMQNAQLAMVNDLQSFNTHIEGLGGELPEFSLFVGEGNDIPKDERTYAFLRQSLDDKNLRHVGLWSTGSFEQGVSVAGPYQTGMQVPDAGVLAQIYDFYDKPNAPADQQNPYVNADTDPADAATLGQGIYASLQYPQNAHMNPELVSFADRAVHVFNFSGSDEGGKTTDAPVFGGDGQSGVKSPGWDLASFEPVMQGYAQALSADPRFVQDTDVSLALWAAENALEVLMPASDVSSYVSAVLSSGGADDEERIVLNKYDHNVVLVPETDSVSFTLGFSAAYRNGVGLYPLLDDTGRLVTLDGELLHPGEAGYLQAAKELAQSLDLWRIDERPGQDSAYHAVPWSVDVDPGVSYALVGASDLAGAPVLYASLSAANADGHVHFAGSHTEPGQSIGFEDLPGGGDDDYNDVTLTLTSPSAMFESESVLDDSRYAARTLAPELDSLWMDGTALDQGTAYQLAELIVGHPGNHDLALVIDVSPPNNTLLNPTPKSHQEKGFPRIETSFEQYKTFLDNIDLYVEKLSSGDVTWTGQLVYHPQTETSEFNASVTIDGKVVPTGWAGYEAPVPSDPSKTFTLTSDQSKDYEAYIDWMGAFNDYMTVNAQTTDPETNADTDLSTAPRTFSEFLFEPEASNWQGRLDDLFGPDTARAYQGNPDLFAGDNPPLESDIPFTVTSSALANWDSDYERGGWGADGNWAQIYDLMNDPEYKPQWPADQGQAQLDPAEYSPAQAAQMFIDFFVSPDSMAGADSAGGAVNPRAEIYNINRLVVPQATSVAPAIEFDARAHLIFTYGPDQIDGPVFKNDDGTHASWEWSKEAFADMVQTFRQGLPPALDQVANQSATGQFEQTKDDLNIGVWGSDRALDAWFGIPDPGQLALLT